MELNKGSITVKEFEIKKSLYNEKEGDPENYVIVRFNRSKENDEKFITGSQVILGQLKRAKDENCIPFTAKIHRIKADKYNYLSFV